MKYIEISHPFTGKVAGRMLESEFYERRNAFNTLSRLVGRGELLRQLARFPKYSVEWQAYFNELVRTAKWT